MQGSIIEIQINWNLKEFFFFFKLGTAMFGKTSYDCWFKKVLFNIKKKKKMDGKMS